MKHTHYWQYPYSVYQGRTDNEVAVIRFCETCHKVEMAWAQNWSKVPREYDVSVDVPFKQEAP